MTTLRYGSATDVGKVRTNNEDQLLVAEPLFAVADGMGGHAAGEVAALAAVEALKVEFERHQPADSATLADAVSVANRAVWERSAGDPELRGMGTTITAVALVTEEGEEHIAIANVGDSRAYLLRDGELEPLTVDHSVAEQMVRDGQLTPEEAAVHPQRHVLTRVLGITPEIDVDYYPILPYKGDRYLLCSDGLVNEVTDDQIASVLRRLADSQEAADELVTQAKANGGHDNITVIVVDVIDDDDKAAAASAALANADDPPTIASPATSMSATILAGTDGTDDNDDHDGDGARAGDATVLTEAPPDDGDAEKPKKSKKVKEPKPRGPRKLTFRVVLFGFLLIVVLGCAAAAVTVYARGAYFVGLEDDDIVIYQGRPGGLLWFDPTIKERTNLKVGDLPQPAQDELKDGKAEPSVRAARRYLTNQLEAEANARRAAGEPAPGATSTTSTIVEPTGTTPTSIP